MMYFIAFIGGFILGFLIIASISVSREEEYHADLNDAIQEAFWKGYETAQKENEK